MRYAKTSVVIALMAIVLPCQTYAQDLSADMPAQTVCGSYNNPNLAGAATSMCNSLLPGFKTIANTTFKFNTQLLIVGRQCGAINAFFDPQSKAVVVCYELWNDIANRLKRDMQYTDSQRGQLAAGAMFFAFMHELGHAVINLYNVPVFGREEDAADQIATMMMVALIKTKPDVERGFTAGAHWFFGNRQFVLFKSAFSDEHAVNPQRQYNIACWVYGSDPQRYLPFAQYAKLPAARAQRCPSEWQQMLNATRQMLAEHIKH